MEDKIYQVLRKHRLPLKKREELMPDLLILFSVSQQRELLLAFFDELDELPMGLMNYDREKVVERFIANNCG